MIRVWRKDASMAECAQSPEASALIGVIDKAIVTRAFLEQHRLEVLLSKRVRMRNVDVPRSLTSVWPRT